MLSSWRVVGSYRGRYVPFALVAAGVLLLDQWSKAFVTAYVNGTGQGDVSVLGGAVLIDPITNSGAAFGVFPDQTIPLIAVAIIIVVALAFSFRRVARGPLATRVGLAMILGGAFGNLLDRVRLGHVTDFIQLGWFRSYPVFNVADSCIFLGVATLIVTMLRRGESGPREASHS